jgi:hypothetical protein
MIESLLILVLYVVIVGIVLWLISYLIGAVPMEPHFKQVAKVLLIVVGIVIVILLLLRYLPLPPAALP